jgi:hypothetical protein
VLSLRISKRDTPFMGAGTTIIRVLWHALGLELPVSRRSQGARFFAGLKPLLPTGYASLLRAIARTLVESDYVPVRKDARHDPVELIAAALEISIERWDRGFVRERGSSADASVSFWFDIALRAAAFEALFRCRLNDERWAAVIVAVTDDSDGAATQPDNIDSITGLFDRARIEASNAIGTKAASLDAVLAEIVVLGSASASARLVFTGTEFDRTPGASCESIDCRARTLRLAHGMALFHKERIVDALAVFEAIVDRVPGHTLALEQAARCSALIGDLSRAHNYLKRASRLGRSVQHNAASIYCRRLSK